MKKYRIVSWFWDNSKKYYPQKKVLFWWKYFYKYEFVRVPCHLDYILQERKFRIMFDTFAQAEKWLKEKTNKVKPQMKVVKEYELREKKKMA